MTTTLTSSPAHTMTPVRAEMSAGTVCGTEWTRRHYGPVWLPLVGKAPLVWCMTMTSRLTWISNRDNGNRPIIGRKINKGPLLKYESCWEVQRPCMKLRPSHFQDCVCPTWFSAFEGTNDTKRDLWAADCFTLVIQDSAQCRPSYSWDYQVPVSPK